MKLKILSLALFALLGMKAHSQAYAPEGLDAHTKEAAFKSGEKLTLTLQHSMLNSNIVEVVFRTTNTIIDNTPTYKIYANAKTSPGYKFFYDLDDTYETWLDISTLRPVRFSSRLKEGKYRFRADYTYDWSAGKVHTSSHKLNSWPEPRQTTMLLQDMAGDALTLFYNLRSENIESFKPGELHRMTFVMNDTVRVITYKFLGKEKKKIGRLGTFNTLKISCQLASTSDEEGQTFKDGSELYVWLTDDKNHMPLYIESPIKIGSIVAELTKYEGLKHPLSSKIK